MEEFKKNEHLMGKAGFRIEEFGETEIKVSAIPELFGELQTSFFIELLEQFNLIRKGRITSSPLHMIATKACKSAIKSGDELTMPQLRDIVRRMEECSRPFTCPHGRPTIITITEHDIEKMFRRKG